MSAVIQYDFLETPQESEYKCMQAHINRLELSLGKIRRGQFAAIGENKKRIKEIEERMDIIERNICQK